MNFEQQLTLALEMTTREKITHLLRKTVKNGCTPEEEASAKQMAAILQARERKSAEAGIDLHNKMISRLQSKPKPKWWRRAQ